MTRSSSANKQDLALKNFAPQYKHSLSLSGTSQRVNYYVSLGAFDQGSLYRSNALNYNRYNLRSNINTTFDEIGLKVGVNINGAIENKEYPSTSAGRIWELLADVSPLQPAYNEDGTYRALTDHPLVLTDKRSGYDKNDGKYINVQLVADWTLPWLKDRHEVHGKTIRVADKGLNCSENILSALANGDGYLFSKSVKQLPETEKVWVLLPNDYKTVKDRNGEIIYYYKECIDEFSYTYTDEKGKKRKVNIKEKRVVTYNPTLARKHKYEINKLVEKAKGLSISLAKKSEYGESAKYVTFKSTSNGKETEDKVKAVINQETIDNDITLAGYNMLVTSEIKTDARQIYETYHNLWRIEESFRIMKSDLDARPVYLQLENTIKGHFLICYLTVLLQRIFQFKVLENKYSSSELNEFYKGFQLVEGEDSYTNISIGTDFITELSDMTGLPLDNYFLSPTKLKKVLNYRF